MKTLEQLSDLRFSASQLVRFRRLGEIPWTTALCYSPAT